MPPDNHAAALMASTLSEIIADVKGSRPTTTSGSGLALGHVFSQMPVGLMVDPREYKNPWTPAGGTPPETGAEDPAAAPDPARARRAQEAAYNTCELVDKLIMVTDDGTYAGWPTGRRLSVAYGQLLQAMEAPPAPERSAAEQKAIDKATKVLFDTDDDGLQLKTALYRAYTRNANDYAAAKAAYAQAAARAQSDPAQADIWPMTSVMLQRAVDDAWDTWKAEGADKVEAALATLQSLGIPLEQGMIAKARRVNDVWQLGLAGVPEPVAYASVSPKAWADPAADDIGFTKLVIESSEYHSHFESHGLSLTTGNWSADSSRSSGEGGIGVFGFGFVGGGGGTASSSSSGHTRSDTWNSFSFKNDAQDLRIELEYGLCEIRRPFALFDVFYLHNYWIKGNKAGCISDGTLQGQVDKADPPMLPMVPTHFLVIRNVKITARDWGSDGQTLSHLFGQSDEAREFHSSDVGGGAAVCIGPFSFGGRASHQESHFSATSSSQSGHDSSSDSGGHFDGSTLTIDGAQIVAWLGEIVPYGAPLDDPDLAAATQPDEQAQPVAAGGRG